MKHPLYLCLLIIVLLYSFVPEKKKTSLEESGIKGKVKSIKFYSFKAIDNIGPIATGDTIKNETVFIRYDTAGNMVEDIGERDDGTNKWIYSYDEKENLLEYKGYKPDGTLASRWLNIYDSKNNLTEVDCFNARGVKYIHWFYDFDSKNFITQWQSQDSSNLVNFTWLYTNDSIGNRTNTLELQGDIGPPYGSSDYTYDNHRNMITERNIIIGSDTTYIRDFYDNKDRLICFKQYINNKLVEIDSNSYDDFNNIIASSEHDIGSDGNNYSNEANYAYTYDTNKNWIKKISYRNHKVTTVTFRQISYY